MFRNKCGVEVLGCGSVRGLVYHAESLGVHQYHINQALVVHICNPSTWEVETRQSGVQGKPGLQESLCQKRKKKKERKETEGEQLHLAVRNVTLYTKLIMCYHCTRPRDTEK